MGGENPGAASVAGLLEQLAAVRGRGEAADGRVVVELDGTGKLVSLAIEPKAMRLGSQALVEAVMNAHEAARTEVRAKGEESAAAPVESAVMPEVKDTLDHLSSDLDKTLQQLVTMTTDAFAKLPRKD